MAEDSSDECGPWCFDDPEGFKIHLEQGHNAWDGVAKAWQIFKRSNTS